MFSAIRKTWENEVALFLPAFELTFDCFGPGAALQALDVVYSEDLSPQEGALYLAYLRYFTFVRERDQRAPDLKERIRLAEEVWKPAGRVNAKTVKTWRERAALWEKAAEIS